MKKFVYLLLGAAIVLTACSGNSKPQMTELTAVSTEETSELVSEAMNILATATEANSIDQGESVGTPFSMNASFVDRERLGQYEDAAIFLGITDSKFAASLLVTVNQPVKNFKFWELNMEITDDGELIGRELTVIDEASVISPQKSAIVTAELGEFIPTKGFSFVDPDGQIRHYYIMQSGEDGSAIVEEFMPE